ncbi:MAG: glycosyltransferase family 4 protein [Candidatus Acidiferrum sp.]
MPDRRYRALVVASHPVPYAIPVFRGLASHPQLDFHVAYCSLLGAQPGHDSEFGTTLQWDVPLLDGYSWSHVPNKGSGNASFFGMRNPGLWPLIRDGNFDVISLHLSYTQASFWIAYLAARFSRSALLFGCDQGSLDPRDGRNWKRTVKRLAWPRLFGLADQVCVSSSSARDLMLSLKIEEGRISLTPLVVDNDWWTARAGDVDRSAVRQSWHVPETGTVVLFCAKLQEWKRPMDLLQAFAQANVSHSVLVFAGEGPLRRQLETESHSLGIHERVRFLGFVNQSQLPSIYTSADLMVLPSDYEPFAVVVNEAMCCGCPVAASDHVGAARDLVAPVRPDFVFSTGDVPALAALLRNALADRGTLAGLRNSAMMHMRTWSPERNVAATFQSFESAISHKGRLSGHALQKGSRERSSSATP